MSDDTKALLVGLGVISSVLAVLGAIFSIIWVFTDDLGQAGEIFLVCFITGIAIALIGALIVCVALSIGESILMNKKRKQKER